MKCILVVLLTLLSTLTGKAQKKEKIAALFKTAYDQVEGSLYTDAIQTYKKIIRKAAYSSPEYAKSIYNTGYLYGLLEKYDSAKIIFTGILEEDFDEMDKGGKGEGIMADPYALYKHNACENLASIELHQGNYKAALDYIKLFDTEYPYKHFCGNEWQAYYIYKAQMYAKAYLGLKDTTRALTYLLQEVFDTGLASNRQLVSFTLEILQKKYTPEYLCAEMQKAIESLFKRKIGQNKNANECYVIEFMGTSITVPDDTIFLTPTNTNTQSSSELQQVKNKIKESVFFKKLAKQN